MTIEPYSGPPAEFPSHSIYDRFLDNGGATRVLVTDDEGIHFAWQLAPAVAEGLNVTHPERLAFGGLRTPSAARQAEMATALVDGNRRSDRPRWIAARLRQRAARHREMAQTAASDEERYTQQTLAYLCDHAGGVELEDLP